MAADTWKRYDSFPELLGDGSIDMDGDDFKMSLHLVGSNCTTLSFDEYGDLDNEHANQYGYVTGGEAITTPTWVTAAGEVTFDCDNVAWNASGGSIVCRFAVIYDDTATSPLADILIGYSLLDNTPGDVTVTTGNTLTVQIHANGVLKIAGGQT